MTRLIALAIAAAGVTLPPAPLWGGEAHAQAPRRVDQLRAGPYLLTVYEGRPPTASNAKNSLSRGIRNEKVDRVMT